VNGGSDTISGAEATLNVASGVSAAIGGGESDSYEFASTFGADTINNLAVGSDTTANGTIGFASGVSDENLWFQTSGSNLLIDLLGTTDQITISNWTSSAGDQVASFTADGSTLLNSQVATLVSAMAHYSSVTDPGFNPQTATSMPTDTTLQSAIAASW
jgi:hypothetical protein